MTAGPGPTGTGGRLDAILAQAGLPGLDRGLEERFEAYLALILRWNARINLTAIRDVEGIVSRHFVESIACAASVPTGVGTLLDFGSGAGFPGIPIALCRPEIKVTLAESQNKKAAFLREAMRTLELEAVVHGGRAEELRTRFDCVVLRAVDGMEGAVSAASRLVLRSGWIMTMSTGQDVASVKMAAGDGFSWAPDVKLPFSAERLIAIGQLLKSE